MASYFNMLRKAQMQFLPEALADKGKIPFYDYSRGIYKLRYDKEIVGVCDEMLVLFYLLNRVIQGDSSVLLLGETGTGKDLFARALHFNKNDESWHDLEYKSRYHVVNLPSIPKELIASELFGYVKGAFTGADTSGRTGAFQNALNGTILLDEIGDMPIDAQAVLLRVLEDKRIKRLGDNKYIDLEKTRIVVATHKNLPSLVYQGRFREDLYYRIAQVPLCLPPLRDRGEQDIEALVSYFINSTNNGQPSQISPEAMKFIKTLSFSGNVRTLENLVKQSKTFGSGVITEDVLRKCALYVEASELALRGEENRFKEKYEDGDTLPQSSSSVDTLTPSSLNLGNLEMRAINEALRQTGGNVTQAAKIVGLIRPTLYSKMRKYGIKIESFRKRI